ncbi:MAG: flagellar biosynthetic protein FliO [Polyangiaceae bacterium]|nr:flagellar biosynthetic protein FliO [Polyangiaceae bacterium]MCW5792400.1 flagellar biosynthetic protein FliO [Polyangiaceae bacterium]
MASYLIEAGITLLAVVALAVVVLYAARRAGIGRAGGPLELTGRLPLDARRAIYLVRIGSKTLVVGASEAGLTRLGELDNSELPAPPPARPDPFAAVLARALGRAPRDAQGDERDEARSDDARSDEPDVNSDDARSDEPRGDEPSSDKPPSKEANP